MTPQNISALPATSDGSRIDQYPGGEDMEAYRWAFNLWVVLFLSVICAGLINYFGIYAKTFYPTL
jgi:hypothetical protein